MERQRALLRGVARGAHAAPSGDYSGQLLLLRCAHGSTVSDAQSGDFKQHRFGDTRRRSQKGRAREAFVVRVELGFARKFHGGQRVRVGVGFPDDAALPDFAAPVSLSGDDASRRQTAAPFLQHRRAQTARQAGHEKISLPFQSAGEIRKRAPRTLRLRVFGENRMEQQQEERPVGAIRFRQSPRPIGRRLTDGNALCGAAKGLCGAAHRRIRGLCPAKARGRGFWQRSRPKS